MKESYLERRGQDVLEAEGYEALKLGWEGWPDREVFVAPRRHEFIEWKRPGGRLTPAQERRIPKLRARGEVVHVIDNLAALAALIREWRRTYGAPSFGHVPASGAGGVGDPVP